MANAIHSPHFLLMLKQCPSLCSSSRTSWMFCIFIIVVPSSLQDLKLFSKCSDLTIVHRGPFCCLWEQFGSIRQVLIVKSKNMWVVYFHLLLKSFCDFVCQCISCPCFTLWCGIFLDQFWQFESEECPPGLTGLADQQSGRVERGETGQIHFAR